ncbi:MAG: hypothetical protein AMXMBFR84_04000 [Candidatus Hydrogenedentota bacterium]
MPSVAVPASIMMAVGVASGIVTHRKEPRFWKASVVGGLAGAIVWVAGAMVLVVSTEGLGWTGMSSLVLIIKSFAITCTITFPASIVGGLIVRWIRNALSTSRTVPGF